MSRCKYLFFVCLCACAAWFKDIFPKQHGSLCFKRKIAYCCLVSNLPQHKFHPCNYLFCFSSVYDATANRIAGGCSKALTPVDGNISTNDNSHQPPPWCSGLSIGPECGRSVVRSPAASYLKTLKGGTRCSPAWRSA